MNITGLKGYNNEAKYSGGCISSKNLLGNITFIDIDL